MLKAMAKSTVKSDREYQAKWDLDTLRQAREIEANKPRMTAAKNYAKEQVKMLGGIVTGPGKPAKKK